VLVYFVNTGRYRRCQCKNAPMRPLDTALINGAAAATMRTYVYVYMQPAGHVHSKFQLQMHTYYHKPVVMQEHQNKSKHALLTPHVSFKVLGSDLGPGQVGVMVLTTPWGDTVNGCFKNIHGCRLVHICRKIPAVLLHSISAPTAMPSHPEIPGPLAMPHHPQLSRLSELCTGCTSFRRSI
jgi:hypothetical protein